METIIPEVLHFIGIVVGFVYAFNFGRKYERSKAEKDALNNPSGAGNLHRKKVKDEA